MSKKAHLYIGAIIPTAFTISSVARPLLSTAVGIPKGMLAILPLASNAAQILLRPIFGVLCDRYGRKIFMVLATLIYSLSYVYQSFAQTALDMVIASFVVGMGVSMFWTSIMAYATDIASDPREGAGELLTYAFAGSVVGSFLSGIAAEFLGWRSTLMVSAFLALIAFVISLLVKDIETKAEEIGWLRQIKMSYKLAGKTIINANSLGLWPVLRIYLPVIFMDMGFTQTIIGFLITLNRIIVTIVQKPSVKLSKRSWFSVFKMNLVSVSLLLIFCLSSFYKAIIPSLISYFAFSATLGLMPSPQLGEVTRDEATRGSGAGGYGMAMSISRLIASFSATFGGALIGDEGAPIYAITMAIGITIGISIIGKILEYKSN